MRLIDGDALRLMKVEECAGHTIEYAAGWKACVDWIKTQPTIDAVPVVRGQWLWDTTQSAYPMPRCSVCGKSVIAPDIYCTHCGSKNGEEK